MRAVWSPRERGWTTIGLAEQLTGPVVPARAGVDPERRPTWPPRRSGPRASGGGPELRMTIPFPVAWSPRERGWTPDSTSAGSPHSVVPARAGVDPDHRALAVPRDRGPRASGGGPLASTAFARVVRGPRASGGGPALLVCALLVCAWSPRERGWTLYQVLEWYHEHVVPARAGVDLTVWRIIIDSVSGPRASGGGPAGKSGVTYQAPWSPRERGWTRIHPDRAPDPRVVPARAGVDPAFTYTD